MGIARTWNLDRWRGTGPWLLVLLVLAAAVRVWMSISMEASVFDAIPITESHDLFGYHDPFSLIWGQLSRLMMDEPPLWWYRFPSLAASLVTVISVTRYGIERFGLAAGVLAGVLLSLSFPLVISAAIVRGYAIHVLGVWLLVSAVERLVVDGTGSRRLVAGAALCLSHQWALPFIAVGGFSLMIWFVVSARLRGDPASRERQLSPDVVRAFLTVGLLWAAMAAAWMSSQFLLGMKAAYQQGSPHLYASSLPLWRQMEATLGKPLLPLMGGTWATAVPVFLLAVYGVFKSISGNSAVTGVLPTAWCLALLIPVIVDLSFGSVGFQVGHWAFLSIPLALWTSVGAVRLVPRRWKSLFERTWPLFPLAVVVALWAVPNARFVANYQERGYHLAMDYSWNNLSGEIRRNLAERNLIFMESERLFLSSHMFAYDLADEGVEITLVTEKLLGQPLFRRFLLHDLWQVPGRYFPLHRWQDLPGLASHVTHYTGRVIMALPNPEVGPYRDWFEAGSPYLPRMCSAVVEFPPDMRAQWTQGGWVAWFDVDHAPVSEIIERIERVMERRAKKCFTYRIEGPEPNPPGAGSQAK